MAPVRKLIELTSWRTRNGLSRAAAAEHFNVSPVTIWRWEAGERRPARHLAGRVSEETDVPLEVLLGI